MRRTRTLSLTSGKGGVGKTMLTSNLASYLADRGSKVLIFDADLGMANVEIFFGARPTGTLLDVMKGQKSVREILCEIAPGISLLSGGSGLPEFSAMNNFQRRSLLESVMEIPQSFDWMLIDTAPGISDNVLYFNAAAEKVAVVVTPDPASLTDAYALIKVMSQKNQARRFSILCNQVRDDGDGFALYRKFQEVVSHFLDVSLDYMGSVPLDSAVKQNTRMQRLILKQDPQSIAAQALCRIGSTLNRQEPSYSTGGLEIYWQQVVGLA